MKKRLFALQKKTTVYLFQITESAFKVIKCLFAKGSKPQLADLEFDLVAQSIDDKELTQRVSAAFKKLGYNNNPIIISLPRNNATCRYLKIPAQAPEEIDKMVSLQAPRYLPYSAAELTTAYQVISTDKEGYTYINLVIVHNDVVERYVKILKELKFAGVNIVLSSYGLCAFYNYLNPDDSGPVMVIDVDSNTAELAVLSRKKVLYSRSFKIIKSLPNWESLFIDEVNKSRSAYAEEVALEPPGKIAVIDSGKFSWECAEILKKKSNLPAEILPYAKKIAVQDDVFNRVSGLDNSFASLIGLGLEASAESLCLMPNDMKKNLKKAALNRERARVAFLIFSIIFVLGLAIAKDFDNKMKYGKQLVLELKKIEKEARPLAEIEKKFNLLESRILKKVSGLSVVYELYQIMPAEIFLVNLTYEEEAKVILRGQASELNSVLGFVSNLEESDIFKGFNVKISYAAKKNTPSGEIMDFEIACSKKK